MARFHLRSGPMMVLARLGLFLSVILILHGVSDFACAQSSEVVAMSDAVKLQLQQIESSFASNDYEAAKTGADSLLSSLADQEGVAKAIQKTGKLFYKADRVKAVELFRHNVANHPDSKFAMYSQGWLVSDAILRDDEQVVQAELNVLTNRFAAQETLPKAIYDVAMRVKRAGKTTKSLELHRYNIDHFPVSPHSMQSRVCLIHDSLDRKDYKAAKDDTDALLEQFVGKNMLERFDGEKKVAVAIQKIAKRFYEVDRAKALELYHYNITNYPDSEFAMYSQCCLIYDAIKRKDNEAVQAGIDMLLNRFAGQKALPKGICDVAKRFEQARNTAKALELHRYNVEHFSASLDSVPSRMRLIHNSLDRKDYEAAKADTDVMLEQFAGKIRIARPIQKIAKRFYEVDRAKALGLYRSNIVNYPDSEFAMYSQCWLIRDAIDRDDEQAVREGIDTLMAQCNSQETLPNQMLNITSRYLDADKPQKAGDVYQYMTSLLAQEDDTLLSLKAKAIIEIKLSRFSEAKECMNALYRDFSDDRKLVSTLIDMAQIYHHAGKDEEALVHYNYILANHSEKKLAMTARKRAALAYIGLGQDEQVQATIETLKADYGDHPDLDQAIFLIGEEYYKVAMEKIKQGEANAAKPYFAKAKDTWQIIVDELPESNHAPHANHFTAECYRNLGNYSKALGYCRTVAANWPTYQYAGDSHFMAAQILKHMKQTGELSAAEADPEILASYETILANYPNSPMAKTIRKWQHQLRRNSQ